MKKLLYSKCIFLMNSKKLEGETRQGFKSFRQFSDMEVCLRIECLLETDNLFVCL